MESARTILELKSAFIRRQLRILSENIEPNENWRDYAVRSDEEDLSEKVVEDVLQKFNAALKQHNRVVYSTQAIHHVAQQIASLYWLLVVRENSGLDSHANGVEKTTDLSRHANIVKLSTRLEDDTVVDGDRLRYQRLRERLVELDSKRQQRRKRLLQLQSLQKLLGPFQDPRKNIQPNLITRDGELIKELEKMRILAARVGARVTQKGRINNMKDDRGTEALPGFDQKLQAVLNMTL